jgi:hypothetical protein
MDWALSYVVIELDAIVRILPEISEQPQECFIILYSGIMACFRKLACDE